MVTSRTMSYGTKEDTVPVPVPAPQDLKTKENPDDMNMDTDNKGTSSSTTETKKTPPTDMDVTVTATSDPKPKARKISEITPMDASAENGVADDDTNVDADVDVDDDADAPKPKKAKHSDGDDGNADNCITAASKMASTDEDDDAGLVSKDPKSTSTGIADKDMKKKDESSVTIADSSNTDTKDEEGGKDEKSEEHVDETEMMKKGKIEEQSNEAKIKGDADAIAAMPSAPDSNAAYYKEMDERKNVERMQSQMQVQIPGQGQMPVQESMQGQGQGQMQMRGQGQGQMPVQAPMQGQGQGQMPVQEPMQGQGQGQMQGQGQGQIQGQGQGQGQMPGQSNQQPYPGNRFPHGHGPPQHWPPPPMGGHPYGQHPPPPHGFRPHPNGMNMPPQFHNPSGPYQGQGQSGNGNGNGGGRGGNGGGYPHPPNPEHGSMPPREGGGYYGGSPGSYPPQGAMPGQHQHGHGHMGPNGYGGPGPGPGGFPPMNNMGMYPPHMGHAHGQGHGHGGHYPSFSGQPGGPPPPYHGMNSPPGPMQQGSRGPMPSGSGPGSPQPQQQQGSPYRGGMMPPVGNGPTPNMPGLGPNPRSRGMPGVGPGPGGPQNWGMYPNTITKPTQNDVLCGRGGATNSHPGNRAFRKLVTDFKDKYLKAKKSAKPRVAAEVVDIIRHLDPSGRFLKKDKSSDMWVEIGFEKAHEKTSQALREGAPAIRKNWDKAGDMPPIKKENKAPIGKEEVKTVETNASTNEPAGKPDGDNGMGMAVVV